MMHEGRFDFRSSVVSCGWGFSDVFFGAGFLGATRVSGARLFLSRALGAWKAKLTRFRGIKCGCRAGDTSPTTMCAGLHGTGHEISCFL